MSSRERPAKRSIGARAWAYALVAAPCGLWIPLSYSLATLPEPTLMHRHGAIFSGGVVLVHVLAIWSLSRLNDLRGRALPLVFVATFLANVAMIREMRGFMLNCPDFYRPPFAGEADAVTLPRRTCR